MGRFSYSPRVIFNWELVNTGWELVNTGLCNVCENKLNLIANKKYYLLLCILEYYCINLQCIKFFCYTPKIRRGGGHGKKRGVMGATFVNV